jgi:hypothetical protein
MGPGRLGDERRTDPGVVVMSASPLSGPSIGLEAATDLARTAWRTTAWGAAIAMNAAKTLWVVEGTVGAVFEVAVETLDAVTQAAGPGVPCG